MSGKLVVLLVFGALGCSNFLGADFDLDADFDPSNTVAARVSLTLAEHPFEVPHVGQPLPPASLTGSGKVTWSGGESSCEASCTIESESETIELVAEPADGSLFGGWQTDPPTACDGRLEQVCTLEVHANVSVRAYMVKDGANVWARFGGTNEGSAATTYAIATSVDGSSYFAGEYTGTLANVPTQPTTIGDTDVVVAKLGLDGQSVAATRISTPLSDHVSGAVTTTFGVVVAGVVGLEADGSKMNLEPVDEPIERDGAFVIGFDWNGLALEPRWSWIVGGEGITTTTDVAVSDDDTTVVLGTFANSLVTPTTTLTSDNGGASYLAAIDANGSEKWVTSLGVLEPCASACVQMQPKNTFVIAARANSSPDLDALGGECKPAPNALFLARFDLSGQCLGVLSLSENVSTVEALRVDAKGNIVFASRFSGTIEFGGQYSSTVGDNDALFIARLAPDFAWEDGVSWLVPIEGEAKFGVLGVSPTGVAFSVNGYGGLLVGNTPFDLTSTRTFQLGKLDSNGKLEWWRTLGDSPHARILGVEWEPKAAAWLVGGDLEADLLRPFDFENVTDSPTFIHDTDSFIARFAD